MDSPLLGHPRGCFAPELVRAQRILVVDVREKAMATGIYAGFTKANPDCDGSF